MEKTFKGFTLVQGKSLSRDDGGVGYFGKKKKDCKRAADSYEIEVGVKVVKATLVVEFE